MSTRRRAAALAILAPIMAACGGTAASHPGHGTASRAAPPARATSAAPSARVTSAASSPGTSRHGNITLAPSHLPPGPFKITPVYCGRFTSAQRDQFGTNATGGFIYKFTNVSNDLTGSPDLSVNFTTGSTVDGSNVTGDNTAINPGQSATGEVDATGAGGQVLTFTGCTLMSYTVIADSGGVPGTYAP